MDVVVATAPIQVPEHLPGSIELKNRAVVAAGIGMMALHQGAIGGLDLRSAGGRRHAQHAIGVSREIGSSQGNASSLDGDWTEL
jgi:hypothetical protein